MNAWSHHTYLSLKWTEWLVINNQEIRKTPVFVIPNCPWVIKASKGTSLLRCLKSVLFLHFKELAFRSVAVAGSQCTHALVGQRPEGKTSGTAGSLLSACHQWTLLVHDAHLTPKQWKVKEKFLWASVNFVPRPNSIHSIKQGIVRKKFPMEEWCILVSWHIKLCFIAFGLFAALLWI